MHSECHRLQPMNIVMLNINIFCMCVEGRVMSQNIRPDIIAMLLSVAPGDSSHVSSYGDDEGSPGGIFK